MTTKTLTKKDHRKLALEKHYALCEQLGKLTGSKLTGKKISTELFKLEKIAHDGATAYCNGESFVSGLTFSRGEHVTATFNFVKDEDAWEKFSALIERKVEQILGSVPKGFFVNGDARGYALKLNYFSYDLPFLTDWGRYQILSPDIE